MARFVAMHGLSAEDGARLLLVVEELVTNLAKYGYDDGAPRGGAELTLTLAGDTLTLTMSDDGRAFDPLAAAPPDLDQAAEDRPVGGLGLHLVRSLAAQADYTRVDGRNRLTLVRRVG